MRKILYILLLLPFVAKSQTKPLQPVQMPQATMYYDLATKHRWMFNGATYQFFDFGQYQSYNQVLSGLNLSVVGSTLTVSTGSWNISNTVYTLSSPVNFTLQARDTIYSRYETVYADSVNNGIHIAVGQLSPNPVEPSVPHGDLRVGAVLITPTGTIVVPPGPVNQFVLTNPLTQQNATPWTRTYRTDTLTIAGKYIFPSVDGTSAQVLQTDGSGHLYWSSQAIYTPGFGMHLNAQAFSVDTTKIVTTVALLDTLRKNAAHFNPKQFIIGNDTINLNPRDTTSVDSVLGMKNGRLYKGKGGGSILSQAYGIIPFSYTGSSPATVGVDTNKIAISNDMILSGMVTTISGPTTANTTAGTYRLGGVVYSIGSTNTTIPAQDATLNRYSVIYATSAGLSISNGSLAADPQIPNVPIGDLLVSTIYIPAVGGTVTPGGGNGGKINANNGLTLKNNQLQLGGPLVHTTNISLTTQTPLTFNNSVNNDNFQVTYGGVSASYANGGTNTTSLQVSPSQALLLINQGGSSQTGIDLDYTYGYRVLDNVFHRGMIFGGNYTTNQRLQRLSVPSVGTTIALIDSVKGTISAGPTIYTGDGTLTSNRTVTGAGNALSITTDNGTSTSESDVSPNTVFTGTTVDGGGSNYADFSTLYSGGVLVADMEVNSGANAKRIEMAHGGGSAGIVVTDGIDNVGLTGNTLFPVSGDPNQYVQAGNLKTIYTADDSIHNSDRTVNLKLHTLQFHGQSAADSTYTSVDHTNGFFSDNFDKAHKIESYLYSAPYGSGVSSIDSLGNEADITATSTIVPSTNVTLQVIKHGTPDSKQIIMAVGSGDPGINIHEAIDGHGARYTSYLDYINADSLTLMPKQYNDAHYAPIAVGGYVPTSRTLTINGTAFDLSANRTWNVGTVTSITPGYGFTSATPITASGTMTTDTTKLQTVLNFFPKGDTRYLKKTDTTAMLTNVVHINGLETILGSKTFTPKQFFTGNVLLNTTADTTRFKLQVNGRAKITQYDAAGSNDSLMAFNPTSHGLRMTKLVAGSGVTLTYGSGNITVAATGSSGVTTFSAGTTGLTPNSATSGAITLAGTLAVANGGTGVTSVTTAPTASAWVGQDANKNYSTNNLIENYQTIATAAGTTTLTVSSPYQTYFTGSTTQTVLLPVASTLVLGMQFQVVNSSTGTVTVQSSGGNTVQAITANNSAVFTCILTSGTSAASWSVSYNAALSPNFATDITANSVTIGQGATSAVNNTVIGISAGASTNSSSNHDTFIGYHAGTATTTGTDDTYIGYNSGASATTANLNTFIGSGAGAAITTQGFNTLIGYNAGNALTAASSTFVGSNAGAIVTTGVSNTFIGNNTGLHVTTGGNNTAVGASALSNANAATNYNTGIGQGAGSSITTGSGNTMLGNGAGGNITTGSSNTFIGDQSGLGVGITTGSNNVSVGRNNGIQLTSGATNDLYGNSTASFLTTGSGNAVFGDHAFNASTSTTGSQNVILGSLAGNGNADNSVLIGYSAQPDATGHTNQIVIGYATTGVGSNTTTIGNTSITDAYIRGAVVQQPTTAAINATATATAAQMATGYITSTSAAATTITTPTATALATQMGAAQGMQYHFTIDNTAGANTVTLALGSGFTNPSVITGANTLTVASGSAGVGVWLVTFTSTTAATISRIQ